MKHKTPVIIVGHTGSGKTEFAVNFALSLRKEGESVVLADMDIVNPYFRARELEIDLAEKGIGVIASNLVGEHHADTPALAGALRACFESKEQISIIDAGGDPHGARVLARYAKLLKQREYHMWVAVNANRPKTGNAGEAARVMEEIEGMSKLRIDGLLNTTHMLSETGKRDVLLGDALVRELSAKTGVPALYTVMEERLQAEMKGETLAGKPFWMRRLISPEWLS